jgi:molybdopterin molybdotransferase
LALEEYKGVDDALGTLTPKLRLRPKVEVVQTANSNGRVSARDLFAPADVPPFAVSHMDGFAVMSEDFRGASTESPTSVRIVGEARLGSAAKRGIRRGEAISLATGSRVPSGADAIVPAERASQSGSRVTLDFAPNPGEFVYEMGSDLRKGEIVLAKGQVVRPQQIGLLLGLGFTRVKVNARPKVSVIATGSELTEASNPRPGKVRESHSPYFMALLGALGCAAIDMGISKDDKEEVARTIRRALARSDFVLTLGGTSVGRADVIGDAVSSLAPDLFMHGMKLDRGRVAGIAVIGGKPLLMMPGPIQGAMNAFAVLGIRIIGLLAGVRGIGLEVSCRMGRDWEARKRFPHFTKVLYVRLVQEPNMVAEPLAGETESIKVLSDADGYVVIPEDTVRIEKGEEVKVRILPGFTLA